VSSSRRITRIAGSLGFAFCLAASVVRCGPGPKDCLRYSDCDPGLTCAYGRCVYPPIPDADGLEGSVTDLDVSSADTATATSGDDATTDDASSDDSSTGEAASGDDASSD
jgi:hypothetical protein